MGFIMKVLTVSDKIKSNIIKQSSLKNMYKFASQNGMMLKSIPLKDGTAAKLLATKNELDCLIMRNGKVLSSKGITGEIDEIGMSIGKIYDHIQKRNRAVNGFDYENESLDAINKFISTFDTFM